MCLSNSGRCSGRHAQDPLELHPGTPQSEPGGGNAWHHWGKCLAGRPGNLVTFRSIETLSCTRLQVYLDQHFASRRQKQHICPPCRPRKSRSTRRSRGPAHCAPSLLALPPVLLRLVRDRIPSFPRSRSYRIPTNTSRADKQPSHTQPSVCFPARR